MGMGGEIFKHIQQGPLLSNAKIYVCIYTYISTYNA